MQLRRVYRSIVYGAKRAASVLEADDRSPEVAMHLDPVTETRRFGTLPSGLAAMVAWLVAHRVEAAVMEGTGLYWEAPFAALEAAGIRAILVQARQVKRLKGQKTDVADSVWLACVCRFGLCTPSHVPPQPFRELCVLSRQRQPLVRRRSSVRNRVRKVIDRAGVRIGGILSDVFGVNGRKILDGLAEGTAREDILASLAKHVAARSPPKTPAAGPRARETGRPGVLRPQIRTTGGAMLRFDPGLWPVCPLDERCELIRRCACRSRHGGTAGLGSRSDPLERGAFGLMERAADAITSPAGIQALHVVPTGPLETNRSSRAGTAAGRTPDQEGIGNLRGNWREPHGRRAR